jgi:hypothetical protein
MPYWARTCLKTTKAEAALLIERERRVSEGIEGVKVRQKCGAEQVFGAILHPDGV